ncbi:Flavohemoprotein [compost metagenome]
MPVAELLRQHDLQRFVDGSFYLCGPLGFMQAQRHALVSAGVPVAHIEREVFGPDLLDDLL